MAALMRELNINTYPPSLKPWVTIINMRIQNISFHNNDNFVDGVYITAGTNTPLVIIVNGHNGFYNYGMFPFIQESLFKNGISSYSFNYSHGGIIGDGDYFEDLQGYEKNCMRLEVDDILSILRNMDGFDNHSSTILLAHSLGGVPAIFAAKKAIENNFPVHGIILISSVKSLNFWPPEMIEEWKTKKVFFKQNNRTKQQLPQGEEFLQEVLQSDGAWNVEAALKSTAIPILIIHGENDEAVPANHGESLYSWVEGRPQTEFHLIPGATHTFNTKHPFEGPSVQLEEMLAVVSEWIKKKYQ